MDLSLERDNSVLGSLFQHIINDMKNTSPLWEDFVAKAGKLHACLRAAIQAIAAYLDAFQKIADAATNSRGASKEIGTALTRVCLRHRAVETRLKTFTAAIMDCLVQPLQEKLEDWKRTVSAIDKEHAKEYKRCRTELKKRSTDTLRLQKKARKGQSDTIQSLMDSHMQDVTLRRAELEEVEKKSLRSAMIEERVRYCSFVHMLQPVVKEECEVMSELGHLQEAMQLIANVTKEPNVLPAASEELIQDAKASMTFYPESPVGGPGSQGACSNSLGSRKSSVCSISSMNSSGSSNSPGHHHYPRSISQLISPAIRLKPGESSDSGFCSSPALTQQASNVTNQSSAIATWPPHSQEAVTLPPNVERPHTISTTYEKGHQRPPLTVYTFQNPETIHETGGSTNGSSAIVGGTPSGQSTPSTQKSPASTLSRPPLPVRCSSLERPLSANANNTNPNARNGAANLRHCPSPIPAHITKELATHHAQQQQQQHQNQQTSQQMQQQQQQQQMPPSPPTYVNMSELADMAALKITNQQQTQQQHHHQNQPILQQQHSIDSISSQHSNDSPSAVNIVQQQQHQPQNNSPTPHAPTTMKNARSHSISSSSTSSYSVSLHSHPSIESTVATPLVGQTPTPSSGSSTPQNHYSPLLTNSPSSTAAGTPSGASIASGGGGGNFVYNICSPTPPMSANSSTASANAEAILKITESEQQQQQSIQSQISSQTQSIVQSSICNNNVNTPSSTTAPTEYVSNNQNSTANQQNSVVDTDSPTIVENDERSRASVLQKASMFEKQAAAVAASAVSSTPPPPPLTQAHITGGAGSVGSRISGDSGIYGTRRIDDQSHYRAVGNTQQDPNDQQDVGGNNTRIPRRSSTNASKPPPPVRRSSSVTPSHNASTGSNSQQPQTPPQHHQQTQQPNATVSNLVQQQKTTIHNSTESLPPPPAFMLEAHQVQHKAQTDGQTVINSAGGSGYGSGSDVTTAAFPTAQANTQNKTTTTINNTNLIPNSALKVAETVKALSAMRHQPASPNALRRLQQQQQHQQQHQQQQQQHKQTLQSFRTTSPGIYAQPKIVNNMSSFRSASPGPNGQHGGYQSSYHQQSTPTAHHLPPTQPKTNPNLIAQLNARLNSKQQQHQQQQQQMAVDGIYGSSTTIQHQRSQSAHAVEHNRQQQNETIYGRNYNQQQTTPHITGQQQQQQQTHDDYVGTNIEKAGSIRSKTKAEFLENLNAKLAKQNISGRAFAVRNLINSKALPDPRVCHESLMDQIKRGATLKRNQKINDRSAPKIH